jgi:hypothetical protein
MFSIPCFGTIFGVAVELERFRYTTHTKNKQSSFSTRRRARPLTQKSNNKPLLQTKTLICLQEFSFPILAIQKKKKEKK